MKQVIQMLPPRKLVERLEVEVPLFQPCEKPASKAVAIRQAAQRAGIEVMVKTKHDGIVIVRLS